MCYIARNLSLEKDLNELKASIKQNQDLCQSRKLLLEVKVKQLQDEIARYSPEYLLSRLRSAVSESDELTESISKSFLDGKIPIEEFMKNFRDTRKLFHARSLKAEYFQNNFL